VPSYGDLPSQGAALVNFKRGLDDLLADVAFLRVPVGLISAIPSWGSNPVPCVISQATSLIHRKCTMNTDKFSMEYFNRQQKPTGDLIREYNGKDGITVISPEDYVCNGTDCISTLNGEFLYADEAHLRRNLKPETIAEFAKLLHFDRIITAAEHAPAFAPLLLSIH
jgi:hypothetical protein